MFVGVFSACILYYIKIKTDQMKMANEKAKIFITDSIMDIFHDRILPHCLNFSSLSALSLVNKKLNKNCKEAIDEQKTKVGDLASRIRSLVPFLKNIDEMPKPSAVNDPITINIPIENNLGTIIIKLENIKTLFIYSPSPYSNKSWKEIGYIPWQLKDITSDPMDAQTSSLIKLALDKLNKELNVKAKESINHGMRKFTFGGFCEVWDDPHFTVFRKYNPMDYGNITNSTNNDCMMNGFNNAMTKDGYFGNLI
jgi:hypothetical protein